MDNNVPNSAIYKALNDFLEQEGVLPLYFDQYSELVQFVFKRRAVEACRYLRAATEKDITPVIRGNDKVHDRNAFFSYLYNNYEHRFLVSTKKTLPLKITKEVYDVLCVVYEEEGEQA